MRIRSLLLVTTLCVAAACANAEGFLHVTGPIPATAGSHPFGAASHTRQPQDLARLGYVEEEYFFSGTANVYDWPAQGAAVVRTADAPYTTRVLIRRPRDARRFSGNAVVEMLNPSNRMDLNIGWALSHEQWTRTGDAWIGITSKPISIVALKTFDPERYAALSWTNPLALSDTRNCQSVAGDSTRETENGLVWDIFRQVALWLRSSDTSNPFAAKDRSQVEHLYAWGYSQTGGFLYTYINAIHPLDVGKYGKSVFDAYLIGVASAPSPINQCSPRPEAGDPRNAIRKAGVPVMRIMTQSDYLRGIAARRPDSDEQDDRYRNYEIAGSAHATPDELSFGPSVEDTVKAGVKEPLMNCNEGPRSRFPSSIAFNAAYRNLVDWVSKGVAPPRADSIRVDNGQPVLDAFGNVTGGVRSPFVDVPTSQWFGNSTGESFCSIAGHEIPFDRTRLKQLYPTHADYAKAVQRNVKALVQARFITNQDGDKLIAQANAAKIP